MKDELPYVTSQFGLPILSQPYLFTDSDMAVFALKCDADKLNDLLDYSINRPSRGRFRYRALGIGQEIYAFMIMAEMTVGARRTPLEEYGEERYSELSFWIPCYDLLGEKFQAALFLPMLFPTSLSAIATGREMFGFAKQLGSYSYPSGNLDVRNPVFEASSVQFEKIGPDGVGKEQVFLSVTGPQGDARGVSVWKDLEEAGADLVERVFSSKKWTSSETGEELGHVINELLGDFPAIFLKQFPSVANSQVADSRSITSAPFQLRKFNSGGLWLEHYDLNFTQLASLPIVKRLGLTVESSAGGVDTVRAGGFWVNVDYQLETGESLATIRPPKKKIAVLGGGLGSLATVYGITEDPDWRQKYDITLYQLGWRLGGKGASGRNREIADRVEEHGLHVWFGYYDNAFQMIQKCYREMGRASNAPLATWQQAFKPQSTIVVEEYVHDRWQTWVVPFRPNDEVPGTGTSHDDSPLRLLGELRRACGWLLTEIHSYHSDSDAAPSAGKSESIVEKLFDKGREVLDFAEDAILRTGDRELDKLLSDFTGALQKLPHHSADFAAHADTEPSHWQDVLEELETLFESLLEPFAEALASLERIVTLVELAIAVVRGILRDGVLLEGYSAINQYDFSEWLERNGARPDVANSVLVRAFYDLYLGFPNGRSKIVGDGVAVGGNVSAGELLHSYVLVVLCYKGAVMWKMQAGMGDTVMTPLYQVLKQRGVRFEFFHQVTDLRLTADKEQIGGIDLDVQATLKDPEAGEYNPLYDVKNLPCWPSAPLYSQLEQGQELKRRHIDLECPWSPWKPVGRKTLQLGKEFDLVVLGISVAALPDITEELSRANPEWKTMLEKASTTQTQAMQLWMNVTLEETGWPNASPILDAYADPFNTWACMNQTLDKEAWPQNHLPFSIAYFCNNLRDADPIPPYSDHDFPQTQTKRVFDNARRWLARYPGHLWPWATASDGKSLDWSKLVDLAGGIGEARLAAQYFRANISPTERYVCNAANTNQYRLKPGESGFSNLVIAGDWVDNGSLNLGCVESTVISGLLAAEALTGVTLDVVMSEGTLP